MTKPARLLLAVAIVGSMSVLACRTRYAYVPTPSLSVEEAKRVIVVALEEQPSDFEVANVVVDDDSVSFYDLAATRRATFYGPSAKEVAYDKALYFRSLGLMRTTIRGKGYVVSIWNNQRVFQFHVVIPDEERCRRFMDAMVVMQRHASRPPEDRGGEP